jgi:hypothetical protein
MKRYSLRAFRSIVACFPVSRERVEWKSKDDEQFMVDRRHSFFHRVDLAAGSRDGNIEPFSASKEAEEQWRQAK